MAEFPSDSDDLSEWIHGEGADLIRICIRSVAIQRPPELRQWLEDQAWESLRREIKRRDDACQPLRFPAISAFRAWVCQVLRHELIDEIRRRQRRPLAIVPDHRLERGTPVALLRFPFYDPGPFPSWILANLAVWPVRVRAVLLLYFRFWERVPVDLWESWAQEAGWDLPFPPQDVLFFEGGKHAWHRTVADSLGWETAKLSRFLNNHKRFLDDLPYHPEIHGPEPAS